MEKEAYQCSIVEPKMEGEKYAEIEKRNKTTIAFRASHRPLPAHSDVSETRPVKFFRSVNGSRHFPNALNLVFTNPSRSTNKDQETVRTQKSITISPGFSHFSQN